MHTSGVLRADDFRYLRHDGRDLVVEDFASFCPAYDARDRVGVVSPRLEDGIQGTAGAILAFTTAFYDVQRGRSDTFFDYPQHFAFIGMDGAVAAGPTSTVLDEARLGATWGNLDVWPESQWIGAPTTAVGMMRKVFDTQISILFWPEELVPRENEPVLPHYIRRMLQARLRQVYDYRAAECNWTIEAGQPVVDMIAGSLQHLPHAALQPDAQAKGVPHRESLRMVTVSEWLDRMAACFEPLS